MLRWKRMTHPFQWERCHITGDYIKCGEYYLEDDEDGLIVSAKVYADLKEQKRQNEWDYSLLNKAANEREYEQMMKLHVREFLAQGLLDRPIEKGAYGIS